MRKIDLRVDVSRGILVDSSNTPYRSSLRMVRGDDLQLNIDLLDVDVRTLEDEPYSIAAGTVFRLVGKKTKDYGGQEMLLADADKFNVVGHRADLDVSGGKISVRMKLNRAALVSALGSVNESLAVVIDLESVTADGEVSTLCQWTDAILNDAARNADQVDDSEIEYMTLEDLRAELRKVTHPDGGYYQLDGGLLKLWDIELNEYVPVALNDHGFAIMEDA